MKDLVISLEKKYPTPESFFEDLEANLKVGALMLDHDGQVEQRSKAKVTLYVRDQKLTELEAEVVYVSLKDQTYQLGLELKGEWQNLVSQAEKLVCADSSEEERKWGEDSESLFHSIGKMDTHQKIQLALKGGRAERRILLKDSHYMVHSYVLKNPKITSEEVANIAKMHSITGDMIKSICDNFEWMSNHAVRLAMIKNPKTPIPVIQKHIQQLRDNDLLQVAKSENVRNEVSKMAKKVLGGRGRPVK